MIEKARDSVEPEDAEADKQAAQGGPQRATWLEHERERDDRSDIRERHLGHHRQRTRIVQQPLFLQCRQQDRRRSARQQKRIEPGMVRAGRPRSCDAERHSKQRCDRCSKTAAPKAREESGMTQRHIHARGEHQHRESDLGQEGSRRLLRIEPTKAAGSDHHPGGQLPHDHRNERALP